MLIVLVLILFKVDTFADSLLPSNHSIKEIAYSPSGVYLAVGTYGEMAKSIDASNWKIIKIPGCENTVFEGITWGNKKFYAVGCDNNNPEAAGFGVIYSSEDGEKWTQVPLDSVLVNDLISKKYNFSFEKIIWKNNSFTILLDGGRILSSQNGDNWVLSKSEVSTNSLRDITYGKSIYVAVGDSGTILTSRDNLLWTPRDAGTKGHFNSVIFNGEKFLIVGQFEVLVSNDGIKWDKVNIPVNSHEYLKNPFWDGNKFIIKAESSFITSSDGTVWKVEDLKNGYDFVSIWSDLYNNRVFREAIALKVNSPYAYVFDKKIASDWILFLDRNNINVVPVKINNRVYVPLQFVSVHFNSSVKWNRQSKTMDITSGNNSINLRIGKNEMILNGKKVLLDSAPRIINNTTYVPLRVISEGLGKKIYYDNGIVLIKEGKIEELWKSKALELAAKNLTVVFDNLNKNMSKEDFKAKCVPIIHERIWLFNGKFVALAGVVNNLSSDRKSFSLDVSHIESKETIDYITTTITIKSANVKYSGTLDKSISNRKEAIVYGKIQDARIIAYYVELIK
jgi:hypothetical protein